MPAGCIRCDCCGAYGDHTIHQWVIAGDGCSKTPGTTCTAECANWDVTSCGYPGKGGGGTCDTAEQDAPKSNAITFSRAGTVIPFLRNVMNFTGTTITLTKAGSTPISYSFQNGVALELAPFTVNAGDVYTINVTMSDGSCYGWIPNKSTNVCGPTSSDCGNDADITAVRTLATSKSDLTGLMQASSVGVIPKSTMPLPIMTSMISL
jgi:hypothetical protein